MDTLYHARTAIEENIQAMLRATWTHIEVQRWFIYMEEILQQKADADR